MVVEGSSEKHASTNKQIGMLRIAGNQINRDLIRGTEIDLSIEMSESRDLTISAYLNGTGQEFSQVFKPADRHVDPGMLANEITLLDSKIRAEIEEASNNGNEETAQGLVAQLAKVQFLLAESRSLAEDDVTDDRFKIEDKKQKIAQEVYELTASKRIDAAKTAYVEAKAEVAELVSTNGNDAEKHRFREVIAKEQTFINSTNPIRIEAATTEIRQIEWSILMRMPDFQIGMFGHLVENYASMNDQSQVKQLITAGKKHINDHDWDNLKQVNMRLWNLMPSSAKESENLRIYTGIL